MDNSQNLLILKIPIPKFLRILYAKYALLLLSFSTLTMAKNALKLNANSVALFLKFIPAIVSKLNGSVHTALMPYTSGNNAKLSLSTNAIMINVLISCPIKLNLILLKNSFVLLNLHSSSLDTNSESTTSHMNN